MIAKFILPFTHAPMYICTHVPTYVDDRQPEKAKLAYRPFIQNTSDSSTGMEDIGGIVLVHG